MRCGQQRSTIVEHSKDSNSLPIPGKYTDRMLGRLATCSLLAMYFLLLVSAILLSAFLWRIMAHMGANFAIRVPRSKAHRRSSGVRGSGVGQW